ncbi:MAG: sugar transferase, partial [Solirubrobacteraceae bacterium]
VGARLAMPRTPSRLPLEASANVAVALSGIAVLILIELAIGEQLLGPGETLTVLALAVAAGVLGAVLRLPGRASRSVSLAVVGSAPAARNLAHELDAAMVRGYSVAGRIAVSDDGRDELGVPTLATLEQLSDAVQRNRIELLVIASDAPRYAVLEELSHSCLGLPVTVCELSELYEEIFGIVPLREINAAWFRHVMDSRSHPVSSPRSKRVLDLGVATLAGLVLAPIALLAAVLIRRDGGPALFRQVRTGERGRPFTILKLRTMRPGAESRWAVADDERVTRLGRLLRRTHIDEIPQLLNVLEGDMSLVGPRPEQPGYGELLERSVPFYSRRHAIKPGITGWAQVRCGYGGSEDGAAWKVAHDLYYLKHRSVALDLAILWRTAAACLRDSQHRAEPAPTPFVGRALRAVEPGATASVSGPDGHG